MKNPGKTLCTIFLICFGIFFSILWISLCFFNNSPFPYEIGTSLLYAGILLLITGTVYFMMYKITSRFCTVKTYMTKKAVWVITLSLLVLFILQMILIFHTYTSIGWDTATIIVTATAEDMSSMSYMNSRYTNNIFLVFVFRIISMILPKIDIWLKLDICNALLLDVSLALVFFTVKKIKGFKAAYTSFYISILTFGLFAWILVPYSDVWAMPYTILALFLYLTLCASIKNQKKGFTGKNIFLSIALGLCIAVGYVIKPTVVIAFIAIVLVSLIKFIDKRVDWRHFVFLAISLAVLLGSIAGWQYFIYHQDYLKIEKGLAMTMENYLMIGLYETESEFAVINMADQTLCFETTDPVERHEKVMEVIKIRLEGKGFPGYLNFMLKKARRVTSEGNFYWGGEGDFADFETENPNFLQKLYYTKGEYYDYYKYYTQGLWILLLLSVAVYLPGKSERKTDIYYDITLLKGAIFGILLFLMIFEMRSRYLILFLPYFTAVSGIAVSSLPLKRHPRLPSKNQ